MNLEREETGGGGSEQPSKAQLVQMVNQFLLQNGLPVTAAALQKECEKMLGAQQKGGGRRSGRGGGGKGEEEGHGQMVPRTERCLADWLQRKEQQQEKGRHQRVAQEMPSPPKSPPPPPIITDRRSPRKAAPTMPPAAHSSGSGRKATTSRHPPVGRGGGGGGGQNNNNSRTTAADHRHGPPGAASQSARAGRSLRAASHQRASCTDTENWAATAEEQRNKAAKGGKMPLRKTESLGSIVAAGTVPPPPSHQPPPDPGPPRPAENGAEEGDGIGDGIELDECRWLCANLDAGLVGQCLLRPGPGREPALLVQALRHQLTKAGSLADGEANVRIFAAKDLLQLRNRKQSLAAHFLASDPSALAEFKEQLARLLNAFASFRAGRDYLLGGPGQGRQLLHETSMALRGRRVAGHAVEHLLATLQKLSIRPTAQKELLLNGMLEWLALQLVQPKLAPAILEFGTGLLHNLAVHPVAASTALRHKDQLLAAMHWLLGGSTRNAQVLHHVCGTLYTLLGHARIRQSARERGDLERAIGERMAAATAQQRRGGGEQRPEQQRQLMALGQILRGEVDAERRKGTTANDGTTEEEESFADYIEADIDSTDPLVPTASMELFGQALLIKKFLPPNVVPPPRRVQLVQFAIEEDQESLPGVVPVTHRPQQRPAAHQLARPPPPTTKPARPPFISPHRKCTTNQRPSAANQNGPAATASLKMMSGGRGGGGAVVAGYAFLREVHFERTNSMSSHATFVVENNCRRPLLVTNGFATAVASLKPAQQQRPGAQPRKRAGQAEKLRESSSSETLVIEENASPPPPAPHVGGHGKVEKMGSHQGKAAIGGRQAMADLVKLTQRPNNNENGRSGGGRRPPAEMAKMFSSKLRTQREKWPRREATLLAATPPMEEEWGDGGGRGPVRSATFGGGNGREDEQGEVEEHTTYAEYMAIFAARPKVVRTPPPPEFYSDGTAEE